MGGTSEGGYSVRIITFRLVSSSSLRFQLLLSQCFYIKNDIIPYLKVEPIIYEHGYSTTSPSIS